MVKHKLKIIFVSEYYYPHLGGIEIVIKEIAERLANNGHDIHVITCKLGVEKNLERLNGVTYIEYQFPNGEINIGLIVFGQFLQLLGFAGDVI